jgi:hypothetical protein
MVKKNIIKTYKIKLKIYNYNLTNNKTSINNYKIKSQIYVVFKQNLFRF